MIADVKAENKRVSHRHLHLRLFLRLDFASSVYDGRKRSAVSFSAVSRTRHPFLPIDRVRFARLTATLSDDRRWKKVRVHLSAKLRFKATFCVEELRTKLTLILLFRVALLASSIHQFFSLDLIAIVSLARARNAIIDARSGIAAIDVHPENAIIDIHSRT